MASVHRAMPRLEVSRRVLVVEDDLDAVHSMAVLIKMMGHECQFAINGFAALEIAPLQICRVRPAHLAHLVGGNRSNGRIDQPRSFE